MFWMNISILYWNTRFLKMGGRWNQTCKIKNKRKFSKLTKFLNFWEKSLIYRQKAHTPGKCLLKCNKIHGRWSIWKGKSVIYKAKGPTNNFSYHLMTLKPLNQELEKFLAYLISRGFVKRGKKKEAHELYSALREKRSGCSLRLNCAWWEKKRFAFEFYLDKLFLRQNKIHPQMKIMALLKFDFSLA